MVGAKYNVRCGCQNRTNRQKEYWGENKNWLKETNSFPPCEGKAIIPNGDKMCKEECMNGFGDVLREARKREGLTLEQLALNVGLNKQTISRYERNERVPRVAVAVKLLRALGVPLDTLFATDEPAKNRKELHDGSYS